MNPFGNILDRFLGRGEYSITVPPMDGALRPNDDLEHGETWAELPKSDNLTVVDGRLVASSGTSIFRVGDSTSAWRTLEANINCLASLPDGSGLAGLANGALVRVGGARDGQAIGSASLPGCLTAMSAIDGDTVVLVSGSERHPLDGWARDLLEKGRSGSIWIVTLSDGKTRKVADRLAFPYGVLVDGNSIVVAEAWASRLLRVPITGGRGEVLLENLPGYPARITADPEGGSWLSVFAPRSQLLEFVLREDEYRKRMLSEVPSDYWIAPTLRSGGSFLEPLQQGGVKQLGVLKPWAPSRSYGLLVRLDEAFRPRASFHSRADGSRHGVTSSAVHDGRVHFTAKGDGVIGSISRERAK